MNLFFLATGGWEEIEKTCVVGTFVWSLLSHGEKVFSTYRKKSINYILMFYHCVMICQFL